MAQRATFCEFNNETLNSVAVHHHTQTPADQSCIHDREDYKQAIHFWERLQKELPPNSEILPDIKKSIDEARNFLGEKTSTP